MSDGSSMTSADLLAEWTHDPSCSLRTSQDYSLQTVGKLWPESFTDWPTSATTSHGGLCQQPPLEHPIDATAGGASPTLPTPTVWQDQGTVEQHLARKNKTGTNRTAVTNLSLAVTLLPTPRAQNGEDRNNNIYPRPLNQPQNLENALARLPNDSDPTQEPSADGNVSWEEPPLIPPLTDD